MVKQKKHLHIKQSGKNYAINYAIQGVHSDLKAKDLIGHLWFSLIIDQSEYLVCYLFLHGINSVALFTKKTALLLTNQIEKFFHVCY